MGNGTLSSWRQPWRVATVIGVERHVVAEIDLRVFGGSSLTADIAVPKHDDAADLTDEIPVTYVPARNTIFIFRVGLRRDCRG